jgi:hypothetical protein
MTKKKTMRAQTLAEHGTLLTAPIEAPEQDTYEAMASLYGDRLTIVEAMEILGWTISCYGRSTGGRRWWSFKRGRDKLQVRQADMTFRWMENVCRPREQTLDDTLRAAFRQWRENHHF